MTIEETQKEIIDEFKKYENWFDKRKHLIRLGKKLPYQNKARAADANLIRGCQVSTWFYSEFVGGKMFYEIDSSSAMVKGVAALLVRIFSGQKPDDICRAGLSFIEDAGLSEDFSPIRANSLLKMLGRIKSDAQIHLGENDRSLPLPAVVPQDERAPRPNIKQIIKKIYAKMRNVAR
ncbi:MAG: SufE family protein [Candidatus Paceibacterota bacterium]